MAVKRSVNRDFWQHPYIIENYSVEDRYFMLYLLTNPRSTQLGIYTLPRRYMSFETGYTKEVIEVLLQRFEDKYGQISYSNETQEVTVLKSLKHSVIKGGKPVQDLLKKEMADVRDGNLIVRTYERMLPYWEISERDIDKFIRGMFEHEIEKRNLSINHNHNHNHIHNHIHNSYHESFDESLDESSNKSNLKYDFDSIWKEYPNKKGKAKAFTSYKKAIKDGVDNQTIINGISAYKKEIDIKRTEPEYVAHGSTWFSQQRWEDDYQTNQTNQNKPLDLDNVFDETDNSDQWARLEERKNASNR